MAYILISGSSVFSQGQRERRKALFARDWMPPLVPGNPSELMQSLSNLWSKVLRLNVCLWHFFVLDLNRSPGFLWLRFKMRGHGLESGQ